MTNDAILRQALQLHQSGRLGEAEALYQTLLAGDAQCHPALHLLGLLRLQEGRAEEALALMKRALAAKPGAPETLANLGLALAALGRLEEAAAALLQAAQLMPRDGAIRANLAGVLLQLGRAGESLSVLDEALALAPDDPAVLTNRGMALKALGRAKEALAAFDSVLRLLPDHREALEGRGAALLELQRPAEALAACDRLLALAPDHPGAHGNRGTALWRLERVDEALAEYERAIAASSSSSPGLADILANRANLLWTRRQALEPALADLERAVELAPERMELAGDLTHLKMHAGDWRDFDAAKAGLDAGVRAGRAVVEPFVYQGLSDDPADLQACAVIAARRFAAEAPRSPGRAHKRDRIRIGYVSGEFRAQATSYLAAGLYEAHDRSRFEVIAIDNTRPEQSPMRTRLERAFDRIIPIAGLSDGEAAAAVAAGGIDILVNLNGWFGAHRLGVFARRPAPIQVNYLGFPGTLGAPCMDYILADGVVIEAGEERFFTEQVMRLPHCYQINDDKRGDPAPPPSRATLGLPPSFGEKDGGFVFAHFNYPYKLTPAVFALWLRLLAAAPGSVLWLLEASPLFARNLRAAAGGAGVDPARLVFAPVLPHGEHMARIAAADLFLDSLPYGAHTTGSDALWAGLPLLTCRGRSFAGRVGASLLTALEMPELITEDLAAYEARALELARDPALLAGLRAKLEQKRRSAPLFDTARSTRAIEAAYQEMLDRAQR